MAKNFRTFVPFLRSVLDRSRLGVGDAPPSTSGGGEDGVRVLSDFSGASTTGDLLRTLKMDGSAMLCAGIEPKGRFLRLVWVPR